MSTEGETHAHGATTHTHAHGHSAHAHDYYVPELTGGSESPADPLQTTRVLTIMRADEY